MTSGGSNSGGGRERRITPQMPFGPGAAYVIEDPEVPSQPVQGTGGDVPGRAGLSMAALRQRLQLGDYSGAWEIADGLLAGDPGNVEVEAAKRESERRIEEIYRGKLGQGDRVPIVIVSPDDVLWRNLDREAAFLLSRIDGAATVDEVLDMSSLPMFAACRTLWNLVEQRIVDLRPARRRERRRSGSIPSKH